MIGGVLTVALLIFRSIQPPLSWRSRLWLMRLHSRKSGVPYGVALALAGIITIKDTVWISGIV